MVISELVERMLRVKEKYGDCKVFILSKSLYEGGTIIDAQDTALTSIPTKNRDPEVIMMISNCPIVADHEADEATAELILRKGAITEKEVMPSRKHPIEGSQKIFIGINDIIRSLFIETAKYYLDFSEVREFHDYIAKKFQQGGFKDKGVTIDSDIDAFRRMAAAYPKMFDVVGDRMYLKCQVQCIEDDIDEYVHQLVIDFFNSKEDNKNDDF